ncbi:MAG: hypothetical protein UV29_C0030G0033 [Candidatus Collierbacteria bacterium GW2011_GWD2_42_50]|nr:MAG: hypothetical protein UV29_C0030G0033 [Candidatus Collierbacteria bacterium GW2011_GWD2_42_50]
MNRFFEKVFVFKFVFVVREKRILNSGYAEGVFSLNGGVYLNLVTCDGVWDLNKKSYNKRLVVFTEGLRIWFNILPLVI